MVDVCCVSRNVDKCSCSDEDGKCNKNSAIACWTLHSPPGRRHLGCFIRNHKGTLFETLEDCSTESYGSLAWNVRWRLQ